jgi:hypothetical protein
MVAVKVGYSNEEIRKLLANASPPRDAVIVVLTASAVHAIQPPMESESPQGS